MWMRNKMNLFYLFIHWRKSQEYYKQIIMT